ncbi:class I SAM-dependent methyltransferase [Bauldia litoralis]|uniref:class I SAM-dependent methyltransferase n=1 Tax=Bauldia litoralis TaxID=665467 RepID=UPI0032644058
MHTDEQVVAHYSRPGLEQAILDALAASGHADLDHIVPVQLSGADEFHLGWRPATVAFATALGFPRGAHVLDIGAGIGGPARHFAEGHGVRVTGIDLSSDYVEAANALTRRCGLTDVDFETADALALPFEAETFDGAYTIHAAMNISEKGTLFAEARRVLKPGARFGVYDIMRVDDGEIPYPMPWAATVETSFVETVDTYRDLLAAAGFAIESQTDRGDLARDLGRRMREKAAADGPPPLGLHTVMGPATPERLGNVMKTLEARIIAPIEIIARAV